VVPSANSEPVTLRTNQPKTMKNAPSPSTDNNTPKIRLKNSGYALIEIQGQTESLQIHSLFESSRVVFFLTI
jgi:hypothetical protein